MFRGWYDDKKLYHIIGYLRYKKYDISEIEAVYADPDTSDINDFYKKLKEKALEKISDVEIGKLNYHDSKDHSKIYDILTLFNILSIMECEKNDVRFSFNEFYKHSWDIEHVRSQTPKNLDGVGRQDWIVCNLEYFSGINYNYCECDSVGKQTYKYHENFDLFKNDISQAPNRDVEIAPGLKVGVVCDQLLQLFNEKTDVTESDVYKLLLNQVFNQNDTFSRLALFVL